MQIFLTLKTLLKLFYNFIFPVYKKLSFFKIATEAILKKVLQNKNIIFNSPLR